MNVIIYDPNYDTINNMKKTKQLFVVICKDACAARETIMGITRIVSVAVFSFFLLLFC